LEDQLKSFTRILAAVVLAALVVGPVSAATTPSPATQVAQATSTTTGGVSGTVLDGTGAPVANATVTLHGLKTLTATSDAKGAFQIGNVPPGVYILNVAKPGFQTATESDFTVFSGEVQKVAITLPIATFTALHTIATVRATAGGTFNTSAAAINSVSNQVFLNQGAQGLQDVLNEVPGLQVSMSSNDTNGAAPGSIQYANIRNGLSFETAAEIDGHPLSEGKYGDYVLSFWTPFMFQSYDVIKGPGAQAAQTNYAINGTLNMRTLDPTQDFESQFVAGGTTTGGTFFNARYSGTSGRLGFVADIGEVNDPSVIQNLNVQVGNTNGGYAPYNGVMTGLGYNNNLAPVPGTNAEAYNNYSLLACCYQISGSLYKLNELVKLRYRFSPSTVATVSYLGAQATSDENGDTLEATPSVFQPGPGYNGPVPVGANRLISNVYPAPDLETSNEPMFQAEIASTIGQDTVLARYYHASIDRLITQGTGQPSTPNTSFETLNGTTGNGAIYDNAYLPVDYYEYFVESETDSLGGLDLQYQHPYGLGDSVTLSYSRTSSTDTYWEQEADTSAYPVVTGGVADVTIPTGTGQIFNTYRLSVNQNFGTKLNALLSLYENQYNFTSATTCGTGPSYTSPTACAIDGSNANFQTNNTSHFDERLGLTYRPSTNLVVRASAGSSIAPPYVGLLSKFTTSPTYSATSETATESYNNPNLVPETAFGYDLGADYQLKQSYFLKADLYQTNLFNQFITTTSFAGTCTPVLYPNSNCPAAGVPLYQSINGNVNNARYEGIELSIIHAVQNGFGWTVQGSTQRGYAYDLGSSFYCSFGNSTATPCIPANYNQNLAVVAGQNFNGGAPSTYYVHSGTCPATNYYCVEDAASGVSNQSVPYLQGYAELNWQTATGWYASLGGTLYGKNNSYNEPPFTVVRATVRVPIAHTLWLQIAGNNIFNAYKELVPINFGGVAIPLANGAVAPTLGNVKGPSIWGVQLTKLFGASQ
jgi:outer membrane receptor protein involved in Fe transport